MDLVPNIYVFMVPLGIESFYVSPTYTIYDGDKNLKYYFTIFGLPKDNIFLSYL